MKRLILHEKYTREDVHQIFDGGNTKFTRGAGVWGMHGIIRIFNRPHDYVFFVTIGQDKLGVSFKEGITKAGILTWQSQKRHTLNHWQILDFINHDHTKHNIYLFLRPDKNQRDFRYMGRLAYINHDLTLERPVHFKWQLIDWNEESKFEEIEFQSGLSIEKEKIEKNKLVQTNPPNKKMRSQNNRTFNSKKIDYIAQNEKNTKLGLNAELLVLKQIKEDLITAGRPDLADRVIHTSVIEGDGAGYDIQAFRNDGTLLYIEVKATKGGINSEFFITPNELSFSEEHAKQYQLIRIYEYNERYNKGKFYKIEGNLSEQLQLKPTQYRASL